MDEKAKRATVRPQKLSQEILVNASRLGLAALLALGLVHSAAAKEWTKLTIATEGAFPPYNMTMPDGKLAGFEIDMAKDLCARMKVECTVIAQDWDGIIPGLNAGKYDAIIAGMSITPKRREVINFSAPYTSSPATFEVPKSMADLPMTGERITLNDKAASDAAIAKLGATLKGKIIGAQVSTIQSDFLKAYLAPFVEIRTYPTNEEQDLDLQAGRIDMAFASSSYLVSSFAKPGGDKMKMSGPFITGGMMGAGSGVGLRKSDTDLKDMFDTAIKAAIADGTMSRLAIQWFKIDVSVKN
jgi:octopine/nopaline transport system substrate-binding protein